MGSFFVFCIAGLHWISASLLPFAFQDGVECEWSYCIFAEQSSKVSGANASAVKELWCQRFLA